MRSGTKQTKGRGLTVYGIKEAAALSGVSARTLRYYDEIGLLKPAGVTEAGYRSYGEKEMDLLQQILFYRERGFALDTIRAILYSEDFDLLAALEEHLHELQAQQERTQALIGCVRQTIAAVKGERRMKNEEKFAAFKEKLVKENEVAYGREARQKHGDYAVNESNRKLMNLTEEQWERFKALEEEILQRVERAVQAGLSAESEEAHTVCRLHKEWLGFTWKQYTPQAHKGLAAMYVADERFTAYYDRTLPGCAAWLTAAIQRWAE